MKLPVVVLVSLFGLLLIQIGEPPNKVKSQMTAVVQWQNGQSRPIGDEFFARGLCEYVFDALYAPGDVFVNVTFADKEITEFDDFLAWIRNDSSPGFWYYSSSRSQYNPGQPLRIEFNVLWNQTLGATLPNAECETNVGMAVTTTTPP